MFLYKFEGLDEKQEMKLATEVARLRGMPKKSEETIRNALRDNTDLIPSAILTACFMKYLHEISVINFADIIGEYKTSGDFSSDKKNRDEIIRWHKKYFNDFLSNCFLMMFADNRDVTVNVYTTEGKTNHKLH